MIEVIIDHSYADDYFMISEIRVNINDTQEKIRIQEVIKSQNLIQALVDPDRLLSLRIANTLQVDEKLIDIYTNEIDLL